MEKVTVTFVLDENKDVASCLVKGEWMNESESIEIVREDNVEELTEIKDTLMVKAVVISIENAFGECE